MKDKYEFTQENHKHCLVYSHAKSRNMQCRWGAECKAWKRLVEGGYRLDDRCHLQTFKHPVRNREREEKMLVLVLVVSIRKTNFWLLRSGQVNGTHLKQETLVCGRDIVRNWILDQMGCSLL